MMDVPYSLKFVQTRGITIKRKKLPFPCEICLSNPPKAMDNPLYLHRRITSLVMNMINTKTMNSEKTLSPIRTTETKLENIPILDSLNKIFPLKNK